MSNPSERRREARSRADSVLEVLDEEGHLMTAVGKLVDFSRGGACFTTTRMLEIGQHLRARFKIGPGRPVELAAKVVWTRKKRAGMMVGIAFKTAK